MDRVEIDIENDHKFVFFFQSAGLLSSILDGSCVVRSDQTHSNLGILLELCVTYIRAVSISSLCNSMAIKMPE